jgi:hypothetical protein
VKEKRKLKKKVLLGLMLALVAMSVLNLTFGIQTVKANETMVSVYPETSTAWVGDTFTVDVKISDVINLYSFQINMSFNPDIVEFLNVTEGDFLSGQPQGTLTVPPCVEESWVLFFWSTKGPYAGVDGDGKLATVEFKILGAGESNLDINNTFVLQNDRPYENQSLTGTKLLEMVYLGGGFIPQNIPFTPVNGRVLASSLWPEYIALNATYNALLANHSNLLDDYNSLSLDHDTLQNNYNNLQNDYNVLTDSHNILVTYFNSLNSSYYELTNNYESLNSTYHDFLEIYNLLQSDYNDLESQHDTLTGDLGTTRNLSYLFIISTIVFIATTVYLTIRKNKVKPELETT